MAVTMPKTDKRLLGEWKSDRTRTMKDWVWSRRMTPARRKGFASIFGHLVVRYAPSKMHFDLEGHTSAQPYKVVVTDADSVVITTGGFLQSEEQIVQIHFEGDYYWILIHGSCQREWFKRVKRRKP